MLSCYLNTAVVLSVFSVIVNVEELFARLGGVMPFIAAVSDNHTLLFKLGRRTKHSLSLSTVFPE